MMSRINSAFKRVVAFLVQPIENELPFLLSFFLLISLSPIKFLVAGILFPEQMDPVVFIHLSRAMAISYLLTCAVYYTRATWLKVVFYAIGCTLFSVNLFVWLVFHRAFSPQLFVLVGETNYREATEFITTFLLRGRGLFCLLIIAVMIGAIAFAERKKWPLTQPHRWLVVSSYVILVCSLFGLCHFNVYYEIYKSKNYEDLNVGNRFPYDNVTATVLALYDVRAIAHEMRSAIRLAKNEKGGQIIGNDSLHVVLVIGESYIKSHAQVYGYYLPTTPCMMQEKENGRLFAFNNVIAPFKQTSDVMKNLMCCNSIAEGENWYQSVYFPTCFKKSGFVVNYWDNQRNSSNLGGWDFSMDSFLFDKELCKISYDMSATEAFEYDDQLISDFEHSGKKKAGKYVFDIFHLWGQHVDAANRYPHDKFSRFSAKDIHTRAAYMNGAKRQDVANYDNATYYNDAVMGHIFRLYRNGNAVVVYISDHGEEVYDYRDSKGRVEAAPGQEKNYLKYQFEVPFIIWCSEKYKTLHPDVIRRIKASLNRPFMTDNLCHVLFDLAGLKTIYYRPDRDLISPRFKPTKRLVNYTVDYDAVMRQ